MGIIKFRKGLFYILRFLFFIILSTSSIGIGLVGAITLGKVFMGDTKSAGTLTNYAFAFFIGYASVCFSWARNLDSVKDQHKYFEVSYAAEMFVYTSIIFLFSSAFSYFHRLLDEMPKKDSSLITITEIVQNISLLAFGSAYCVALSMMFKIIALFGYPWTKNQQKTDDLWMRHLRNIKDEEKVDEMERIEALKLKRKNALLTTRNLENEKRTNKE